MQCTVLQHITASVFINDDEQGLHADYEKWMEGLAPHAPVSQCRPKGRLHNRADEEACPERSDRNADAYPKRNATRRVARDGPRDGRDFPGDYDLVAFSGNLTDWDTILRTSTLPEEAGRVPEKI
jgi:hypothetical protein